jgi:outer membrane lipoprotein carrier protein
VIQKTLIPTAHVLICALLLFSTVAAGAAAAESGGEQMDQFFADLKSFSADFTQVVRDADGSIQQTATGTVVIKRPGRFRWDYATPYVQVILGDGKRLWTYDADLEQATVKPLGDVIAGTPAVLLSQKQPPRELFHVSEVGATEGIAWVELRPHDTEMQFQQIRLALKADMLMAMELIDTFDQVTRISFSEVNRNGPVDDSLFEFSLPPGVDLIGTPDP